MGELLAFRRPIPDTGEPWLNTRQIASHYAVSERTVFNWRRRGLRPRKLGPYPKSPVRFLLSEVDDWLRSQ